MFLGTPAGARMEAAQFDRALSLQDFVAARIRKVKSHVEQMVVRGFRPPEHVREYFCLSKGHARNGERHSAPSHGLGILLDSTSNKEQEKVWGMCVAHKG